MCGRKYVFTPNGTVNLEVQWAEVPSAYPLQSVVWDIKSYQKKFKMYKDIDSIFTVGSTCFTLVLPYYGYAGEVQGLSFITLCQLYTIYFQLSSLQH